MASFLKRLFGGRGESGEGPGVMFIYARCNSCKEKTRVRISKSSDLSMTYEDEGPSYALRKVIVGSNCPSRMEAEMMFDRNRNLISRNITGGQFITKEEYESEGAEEENSSS